MAKLKTIDVYANPYAAVDADGVPQGVVQMPGTRNYVGAFIDVAASRKTGKTRFYFATPNADKGEQGAHGLSKVTVPFSSAMVQAIQEGSLIAADKKSAWAAGIPEKDFKEPEEQLVIEAAKALERRRAALLDDTAELGELPTEATPLEEDVANERALIEAGEESISFRKEH